MMKRTAAAVMTILTLTALISCGESPAPAQVSPAQAADAAENVTHPETETEPEFIDSLPDDLDFGGTEINIACYDQSHAVEFSVEQTGEVVDDARYGRNVKTEERMNVKLNPISLNVGWGDYLGALRKVLRAGDDSYDALYLWQYDFCPLAVEGLFLDLTGAPYIDLSQPWWAKDYMANVAVDDSKTYFLFGDFTPSLINSMTALYYNRKLYGDMSGDPDKLYADVLDGKWTFDAMSSEIKGWYSDLNGDGAKDIGDRYGMCLYKGGGSASEYFMINMGCEFSYRDGEGLPVIDPIGGGRGEKITDCLDRIIALRSTDDVSAEMVDNDQDLNVFSNGNVGFIANVIGKAHILRDMEDDYGVLPYPKYDELQSGYITAVWDAAMMAALPSNCQKKEAVCAAFESLAALGYRDVIPVYYEIALKTKYARDEMSSKMIDLLHGSLHADFAYINNYGLKNVVTIVRDMQAAGENTYVSWWAKNESKIQKALEKMINAQKEL